MNLLCALFGIDCVTGKSTRVTSRVDPGVAEFHQLPANVQTKLRDLDAAGANTPTLDQLKQAREVLSTSNAPLAVLRLQDLIQHKQHPGTHVGTGDTIV